MEDPELNLYLVPTQRGAAARRRHDLVVEDEGLLKNFVVIFVFLKMLYNIHCFF
jgi:hypothetical protein